MLNSIDYRTIGGLRFALRVGVFDLRVQIEGGLTAIFLIAGSTLVLF